MQQGKYEENKQHWEKKKKNVQEDMTCLAIRVIFIQNGFNSVGIRANSKHWTNAAFTWNQGNGRRDRKEKQAVRPNGELGLGTHDTWFYGDVSLFRVK